MIGVGAPQARLAGVQQPEVCPPCVLQGWLRIGDRSFGQRRRGTDAPDHHRDEEGRDLIGALLKASPVRVEERRAIR